MAFLNIFITSIIWVIVFTIGFLVWFLIRFNSNKRNFIDVCLRTHTGGKAQVDLLKGQLYRSKRFGEFIWIPSRKMPIPRFDQEVFLPRRKSGRMFLDITASDGYYYANKYTTLDKLKQVMPTLTDEKGKKYAYSNEAEFQELLKEKYKLNDYDIFSGVVNQIPYIDRSQAMLTDEILNTLNKEKVSFWRSPTVMLFGALIIGGIIAIVIIVLAQQHAESIINLGLQESKGVVSAAQKVIESSPPTP